MRHAIALTLAFSCLALGPARAAEIEFGRYHSLVIGINDYKHLPDLQTAVNDASAVHDVLRREYAYESTLLLNPNRAQLVQALDKLRADLTEQDNVLIFYAGHGVLDRPTDEGFWLTTEAEEDSQVEWVSISSVTRLLKASSAKHALVVADSCYSGVLSRNAPVMLKVGAERQSELKRIAGKRARKALTSGGLEPVNDGGGDGHSVFTRAFLESLRENRQIVDGYQLFRELRQKVVLNAEQTPQYSDIRFAGDEGGDFLFVPMQTRPAVQFASAPTTPGVAQSDEPSAGRIELAFWQSIQNSKMAADYEAYLATYPQGKFSLLARNRLASLQAPKAPPKKAAPKDDKQAAEIAFWRSIQQSKNADDYRAYLKAYPNGAFKPIADNRIKQLESQPSTAAAKPKTSEAPKVAALPRLALTPVEAAFVVVRNANVRARPTTDSSVVARLKAGAEVYVDSKTKDGTWMRVERDGKDLGYMFAPLLQDKQRWQEASNRRAAERRAQEDAARRRSEEDATRRRSEEDAARRRSEEDAARRRAEEDAARRQAEESAATRRRQQQAAVVAPRKPVGYDGSWRLIVGAQSFEQGDHGRAERTITVSDGRFQAQLRAGPTSYGVQGEIVDGRLSGVLTVNFADPWLPISVDLRGSVRGGGFEKRYSKSTHDGHDGWDDNYLTLNVDIALRRN